MGASGAERQRRYRHHRAGDHSLCSSDRCPDAGPPAPLITYGEVHSPESLAEASIGNVAAPDAPPLWGERGRRLWDAMADARLGPAHRVLLEEACRIADRLDRLDRLLERRGDDWARALQADDSSGDDVRVVIVVDALLAEARQHATALRGLVAELRQALAAGRKAPGQHDGASTKGGALAHLADAAARRRAAAR